MEIVMTNEYLAPFVDELFNLGVREPGLKTASRTPKLKSSSTKGAKYSLVMTISISNLKI